MIFIIITRARKSDFFKPLLLAWDPRGQDIPGDIDDVGILLALHHNAHHLGPVHLLDAKRTVDELGTILGHLDCSVVHLTIFYQQNQTYHLHLKKIRLQMNNFTFGDFLWIEIARISDLLTENSARGVP